MRHEAGAEWDLERDMAYRPKVTLIIPTYNEVAVIRSKLERVQKLDYPDSKLQVLVVDSNSVDGTKKVVREFLAETKLRFPVKLISEKERLGKSHALNMALEFSDGEIIATSDADSFWDEKALINAVSYFADPSVGAITGQEKITNLEKSIHTKSEDTYLRFYRDLRLGESKIDSTIIFNGGLAMYRRKAIEKFEDKPGYSDDVGTALRIVLRGYRCLYVPDAIFNDTAAHSLRGRIMLKSRRAQHLIAGILQSIRFKSTSSFRIPWSILLFYFYMHILLPFISLSTLVAALALVVVYFQFLWFIPIPFFFALLLEKPRLFVVSY